MRDVAANVRHRGLEVLSKLLVSRWRKSRAAWVSEWHEPALGLSPNPPKEGIGLAS